MCVPLGVAGLKRTLFIHLSSPLCICWPDVRQWGSWGKQPVTIFSFLKLHCHPQSLLKSPSKPWKVRSHKARSCRKGVGVGVNTQKPRPLCFAWSLRFWALTWGERWDGLCAVYVTQLIPLAEDLKPRSLPLSGESAERKIAEHGLWVRALQARDEWLSGSVHSLVSPIARVLSYFALSCSTH